MDDFWNGVLFSVPLAAMAALVDSGVFLWTFLSCCVLLPATVGYANGGLVSGWCLLLPSVVVFVFLGADLGCSGPVTPGTAGFCAPPNYSWRAQTGAAAAFVGGVTGYPLGRGLARLFGGDRAEPASDGDAAR